MNIEKDKLSEIYNKMLLTRYFEEKIAYMFSQGVVHGTTHLYVGEEAVAAGVCCALRPKDVIFSTHRGHGHCISKGISIKGMMAEMLGRENGSCRGKGGSMHIADPDKGNYGSNGVVGGGIPLAVGAAFAMKQKKMEHIVVSFFGDGATNEGTFHEALNLASVWKLPILFVCEDNKYGMSTNRRRVMNVDRIEVRAQSYGMESRSVNGNDAVAVYNESVKACEYVKENGPLLLVCDTYRISGHSKSDTNVYRTAEEIAQWKTKDPIEHMKAELIANGCFSTDELNRMEDRARQDIEDALEYAQNSLYPSANTLCEDVYA